MTHPHERLGVALGLAGMALFAGTLPATRVAVASLDPLFLTAARATIAGLAGVLVLAATRRRLPPRALWFEIALAGPLLMALAMVSVPAAHGGVVLGIVPLATAAASAFIGHERPSLSFWLASIAGAVIVVLFVLHDNDAGRFAAGDLFLVGTVIAGSFGYTLSAG
jgi:drug/metabolite transporter (DMT)-like permease